MSDIFISHVEEDSIIALNIAARLEEAGFTSWCYERDALPGVSYLLQTGQAIEVCKAVLLIISSHALGSHQVTKEVVRAHESNKPIIPLLLGVSHSQFQKRQPEWREAIGASTSLPVSPEQVERCIVKVTEGLKSLGVSPSRISSDVGETRSMAVAPPGQPASVTERGPEGLPAELDDEIEAAESYESIGDVWKAADIYASVETKLRGLGEDVLADEMKRRARKNRSVAADIMRGST